MQLYVTTNKHSDASVSILLHDIPRIPAAIRSFCAFFKQGMLEPVSVTLVKCSGHEVFWLTCSPPFLLKCIQKLYLHGPEGAWPRRNLTLASGSDIWLEKEENQECQTLLPNMYAYYITVKRALGAE